jgi:hypothetical protein
MGDVENLRGRIHERKADGDNAQRAAGHDPVAQQLQREHRGDPISRCSFA